MKILTHLFTSLSGRLHRQPFSMSKSTGGGSDMDPESHFSTLITNKQSLRRVSSFELYMNSMPSFEDPPFPPGLPPLTPSYAGPIFPRAHTPQPRSPAHQNQLDQPDQPPPSPLCDRSPQALKSTASKQPSRAKFQPAKQAFAHASTHPFTIGALATPMEQLHTGLTFTHNTDGTVTVTRNDGGPLTDDDHQITAVYMAREPHLVEADGLVLRQTIFGKTEEAKVEIGDGAEMDWKHQADCDQG
ncbi:hypothetical protein MBLNU459_g0315t1 [Dothideomycetes sp. NU459]